MAIVGIDLGTTNSCVAVIDSGEPVVIPNEEGSRITPSVVAFTEDSGRFVGAVAKRQAVVNPLNTIYAVKRLIGRRYDAEEVQKARELVSYNIISGPSGDAWVEVSGHEYSPQEISAIILAKMKRIAEEYLGYEVEEAVITVPAYFNDRQRQATKDAGRIAGFNVRRIINEPTAAALAYGLDKKDNAKVAVVDLRGGTFDVTILEMANGVFEVKSTSGDTFLGGEDFDQRLVELVIEEFRKQHGIDLRLDRMALQRIREASEKAKHELSSLFETTINLPFIAVDAGGPKHLNVKVTRAKFEQLVSDLIERLGGPCQQALEDAKLKPSDIDEVLLVGGMTRMPKVQEKIKTIFEKESQKKINPDEVVAIGAAIQSGVLEGKIKEVLLLDVVPLSLGVETKGGLFTKIIERNTTIPTKRGRIFTTAFDSQSFVSVHVLQGEREMSADNISLARFDFVGILHVSAKDLGTGKEQTVRVFPSGGLSEEDIQKMIKEGQVYAEEDQKRKDVVIAKNEAEGLLYSVGKTLDAYGNKVDAETRQRIKRAMERMKEVLDRDDYIEIKNACNELQEASYKFAEFIYGQGQKSVVAGESGQE